MILSASNLNMTLKHLVEVLKNVCDNLEEKGERYVNSLYYIKMC